MIDADKCQMMAEWEGLCGCPQLGKITASLPCYVHDHNKYPDYPHDLNATMRAARKMPENDRVVIIDALEHDLYLNEGDPARAAFEALSAWLMEQKE